jgi:hypothetical protein
VAAREQEPALTAETRSRRAVDEGRRHYRLTAFGTAVARAEARRLAQMVCMARASGIAPERA